MKRARAIALPRPAPLALAALLGGSLLLMWFAREAAADDQRQCMSNCSSKRADCDSACDSGDADCKDRCRFSYEICTKRCQNPGQ
jgi:hypothetical protein